MVLLRSMKQLLSKREEAEKLLRKMTKEKPRSMNISGKRLELNHLSWSLCFSAVNYTRGIKEKEKKILIKT